MKIACVQMDISLGNVEVNFHNAREGLRRAAEQGADTVLLPEMWNSGFLPPGGLGCLFLPVCTSFDKDSEDSTVIKKAIAENLKNYVNSVLDDLTSKK